MEIYVIFEKEFYTDYDGNDEIEFSIIKAYKDENKAKLEIANLRKEEEKRREKYKYSSFYEYDYKKIKMEI